MGASYILSHPRGPRTFGPKQTYIKQVNITYNNTINNYNSNNNTNNYNSNTNSMNTYNSNNSNNNLSWKTQC